MKQPLNIGKEPSLHKIVITSAFLHLLFIAFIVVPVKTREREFRSYFVNLVGPVEVHRGVTPRVAREAKKKIVAKKRRVAKKKTAIPESKAGMSLESVDKAAREIERIRAISALSKRKKEEERLAREIERIRAISALSRHKEEREKTHQIEVVGKGVYESSPRGSGIPGKVSREVSDSYYAIITRKIWAQWVYPDFDAERLEVVISIRIDGYGNVISHEIEDSSGNKLFDHSAINAILKASPLPPPLVEMEIGVRFYL